MTMLAFALGVVLGCLVWYLVIRPRQERRFERRRRALGLAPKHKLPEDP